MISSCGLTFLLAEIARFRGRQIEAKMIAKNGGKFTTIFLRHRDSTISSATKSNYHSLLTSKAKRVLPSAQEEDANPSSADDLYRGAVDWLLEATRSEKQFPMVRAENISYGFRRNLFGLKTPALLLLLICLIANIWLSYRSVGGDATRFWVGLVVSSALLIAALAWIFVITIHFVEDAGRTYAIRLLAQCDVLQSKSTRRSGSSVSGSKRMKKEETARTPRSSGKTLP